MEYLLVFLGNKRYAQTVNNYSEGNYKSDLKSSCNYLVDLGFRTRLLEHTNSSFRDSKVLEPRGPQPHTQCSQRATEERNLLVKY